MKKTAAIAMVAFALLVMAPWTGHAGRAHVFVGGSFWAGPPPYWGPPPFGPRYYYGGPVVVERWVPCGPPAVVHQPPPAYAQRDEEAPEYWYYCENPRGYYPYIKRCPEGWMRVVPETVPPDR
jgi:hypothetical protein